MVKRFIALIVLITLSLYLTPNSQAKSKKEELITIAVTGDVMLGRKVNQILSTSKDFSLPYKKIGNLLSKPDIAIINLESPLIDPCPVTEIGMVFCGNTRSAQALSAAGVDAASLANNHAYNHENDGIIQTINALEKAHIQPFGAGKIASFTKKGKSFAVLGYNEVGASQKVLNGPYPEIITKQIKQAKATHNYIIVLFHWGIEYTNIPTKNQRNLAHTAIDAGADLIVGNHPHWVQIVEKYKNVPIIYSHGNFIFDQMWSRETRQGVVGLYTFKPNKSISFSFVPIAIDGYFQPRLASDSERKALIKRMGISSDLMASTIK